MIYIYMYMHTHIPIYMFIRIIHAYILQRLKGHEGAILSLAFSLEGCFLVSGSRDCSAKGRISQNMAL